MYFECISSEDVCLDSANFIAARQKQSELMFKVSTFPQHLGFFIMMAYTRSFIFFRIQPRKGLNVSIGNCISVLTNHVLRAKRQDYVQLEKNAYSY